MKKAIRILLAILLVSVVALTVTACSENQDPCAKGHSWDNGQITKPATCAETGTAVYRCKVCGQTEERTLPVTQDHVWDEGKVTTEPTCTQKGVRTYTCTVCKTATRPEDIEATGQHVKGTHVTQVDPTCHSEGTKEYWLCKDNCGTKLNEEGYIVQDSDLVIAPLAHNFNDGVVTTEATCQHDGVKTFTCQNDGCSESYTQKLPKLAHNYDNGVVTTEATCQHEGVKTFTCQNDGCSESFTQTLPKLAHSFGRLVERVEPNCEQAGHIAYYQCAQCKQFFDEGKQPVDEDALVLNALGHDPQQVEGKAPDCTNSGFETYYKCTRCNKLFADMECEKQIDKPVVLPAKGHNNRQKIEPIPADCTHGGKTEGWRCADCGATLIEPKNTAPLGHSFIYTSDKDGVHHTVTCARCDYNKTEECTPAQAWQFDGDYHWHKCTVCSGDLTHEPHALQAGSKQCTECGKEVSEIIVQVEGATDHQVANLAEALNYIKQNYPTTPATIVLTDDRSATADVTFDGNIDVTLNMSGFGINMGSYRLVVEGNANVTLTNGTLDGKVQFNGGKLVLDGVSGNYQIALKADLHCNDVDVTVNGAQLDHTWDKGQVTTPPTCEDAGTRTFTCTRCQATRTEDEPAKGHIYGTLIPKQEPTCTATGTVAHYQCADCHKLFVDENGVKKEVQANELVLDKLAHTYKFDKWTWDEKALTATAHFSCNVCGHTEQVEVKLIEQHRTPSSCVEQGKVEYRLERDAIVGGVTAPSQTFTQTLPLAEHVYGEKHPAVQATCSNKGNKEYYQCSECEQYFVEEDGVKVPADWSDIETQIDETNHKYKEEWSFDGTNHWHECEYNPEHKTGVTGHEWQYEKSTDKDGYHIKTCKDCKFKAEKEEKCTPNGGDDKHDATHGLKEGFYADADHHWQVCQFCEKQFGYEKHSFDKDANDGSCTTCGHKFFEVSIVDDKNNTYFAPTIAEAFDLISKHGDTSKTYTITLTHDRSSTAKSTITVPAGYNVTINLANHAVSFEGTLQVNGSLTVTGGTTFAVGTIVYNKGGALVLPQGDYTFKIKGTTCDQANITVGETKGVEHSYKFVSDGNTQHHEQCTVCGNNKSSVAHTRGEDIAYADDWQHTYKCPDCDQTVKEDCTIENNVCTECSQEFAQKDILDAVQKGSFKPKATDTFVFTGFVYKKQTGTNDSGAWYNLWIYIDGDEAYSFEGYGIDLNGKVTYENIKNGAQVTISGNGDKLKYFSDYGFEFFETNGKNVCKLESYSLPNYAITVNDNSSEVAGSTVTITDEEGGAFERTQEQPVGTEVKFKVTVTGGKLVSVTVNGENLVADKNGVYSFNVVKATTITITVGDYAVPSDETVTKTVPEIGADNKWTNGGKPKQGDIGSYAEVSVKKNSGSGSNTGAYNGTDWRLYNTETSSITIKAKPGYVLLAVSITYKSSAGGALRHKESKADLLSATMYYVTESESTADGEGVTFEIYKSGTSSGTVRVDITSITVIYRLATNHTFTLRKARDASCTEEGYLVDHYICENPEHEGCKGKYFDLEGNELDVANVIDPANGHVWKLADECWTWNETKAILHLVCETDEEHVCTIEVESVAGSRVDATCQRNAYTTYTATIDVEEITNELPQPELDTLNVTEEQTTTIEIEEASTQLKHDLTGKPVHKDGDERVHVYTCKTCAEGTEKATKEEACTTENSWGHSDDQHWPVCSKCSYEYKEDATSHTPDEVTGKCECGYTAHVHQWIEVPEDPADCLHQGHRAYWMCETCGESGVKYASKEDAQAGRDPLSAEDIVRDYEQKEHNWNSQTLNDIGDHKHHAQQCTNGCGLFYNSKGETSNYEEHTYDGISFTSSASDATTHHTGTCKCGESAQIEHTFVAKKKADNDRVHHDAGCVCGYKTEQVHNFQDESGAYTKEKCDCGEVRVTTQNITLNVSNIGVTGGGYDGGDGDPVTINGVEFDTDKVYENSGGMQAKGSVGYIYNTKPFPGRITKIVIAYKTNSMNLYLSNTSKQISGTGSVNKGTITEWTAKNDENYTFFTLKCGSSYAVVTSITIYYEVCNHTVVKGVETPATCTEDGKIEGTCIRCGQNAEQSTTPAKGHNWEWLPATEANCTNPAYVGQWHCVTCDGYIQGSEGSEPSKNAPVLKQDKIVDREQDGGEPLGHNLVWEYNTEEHPDRHRQYCDRAGCDHVEVDWTEHNGVPCTDCGYGLKVFTAGSISTDSLATAFEAVAVNGGTITLNKDYNGEGAELKASATQEILINANGHTLTLTTALSIEANGTVKLEGTINATEGITISGGTIELNGATVTGNIKLSVVSSTVKFTDSGSTITGTVTISVSQQNAENLTATFEKEQDQYTLKLDGVTCDELGARVQFGKDKKPISHSYSEGKCTHCNAPQSAIWSLVKSVEDLQDGDRLIFAYAPAGGQLHVMTNFADSKFQSVETSIASGTEELTTLLDSFTILTLGITGEQYTLQFSDEDYLSYNSGTNFQKISNATANNAKWTISDSNKYFCNVNTSNRGLLFQIADNQNKDVLRFGAYSTANLSNSTSGTYAVPIIYRLPTGIAIPEPEHVCQHVCSEPDCGKCTDLTCQNPVCKDKCPGHSSTGGGEEPTGECYEKITSTSQIVSGGKYLIVCESKNKIFDGSSTEQDKIVSDIKINNNQITNDSNVENSYFIITVVIGGYEIQSQSGKYISYSGSRNGINWGTKGTLTISFSDGNVKILSQQGCTLQYNNSSSFFRFYQSANQIDIQLYILK